MIQNWPIGRKSLLLFTLAYLFIGSLFAVFTPAWQAPDEPAHYNYIAQIAQQGCCPVIEPGDWDTDYLDLIKGEKFHPETLAHLPTIQYEDHQPPLYYLLAAPIFVVTGGELVALRLFSVLLGALIVASTWQIARGLFPHRPQLVIGAAGFVAFLPQSVHILASVNNDALAWALGAVILLRLTQQLQAREKREPAPAPAMFTAFSLLIFLVLVLDLLLLDVPGGYLYALTGMLGVCLLAWVRVKSAVSRAVIELGILVGLCLVTKATVYFWLLLVPLALLWFRTQEERAAPNFLSPKVAVSWLLFFLPAIILGATWWVRNLITYGSMDFLGLKAHGVVVVGQLLTSDYIAEIGGRTYLTNLLRTTYTSFWGQFGWMALPLSGRLWLLTLLLTGLSLGGWGIKLIFGKRVGGKRANKPLYGLLGAVICLTAAAYLYYNITFVQFQGRYLYVGLIPLALAFVLGLDGWTHLPLRPPLLWLKTIFLPLLPLLPGLILPLLDLYLLFFTIVPHLSP